MGSAPKGEGTICSGVVGRDAGAWPALLKCIDPKGRLIARSAAQVEAAVTKRFSGLPRLAGASPLAERLSLHEGSRPLAACSLQRAL